MANPLVDELPAAPAAPAPPSQATQPTEKNAAPVPGEAEIVYGTPVVPVPAQPQWTGGLPQAGVQYGVPVAAGAGPVGGVAWTVLPPQQPWRYSICSCCEDCTQPLALYLDVMCCTLCHIARQWAAVDERIADKANWPVCGILFLGTYLFGGIVPCLATWYLRDRIRHDYRITGDQCSDCWHVCWCGHCVLVQQHRELTARGMSPGVCLCGGIPATTYAGPQDELCNPGPMPTSLPQPGY